MTKILNFEGFINESKYSETGDKNVVSRKLGRIQSRIKAGNPEVELTGYEGGKDWFDAAAEEIKPWSIGVVNPDNRLEVVKVYEITDGAIATSGTYERGAHIHDPHNGLIAIGAASATVVGAAGWLCDAMATAVMVGGVDSARWFGQPELQGYQVFAVNRHDATAWEI
jgi:hypothetical protein